MSTHELLSLNLSSIVINHIKEKVLMGEYKAGDRVLERHLADELNISRAPIREGIRELQLNGILEFVPRKGNYVVEFTMEDVKEIFDVRLLLENNIIETLIDNNVLTDNDFTNLKGLVNKMIEIANSDKELKIKSYELNKKDMEFHKYIWEKSGSKRRIKVLTDIFLQLQMAMLIDTEITGNLEETASEHFYIINALEKKNSEECKKCLKGHIISYRKNLFLK